MLTTAKEEEKGQKMSDRDWEIYHGRSYYRVFERNGIEYHYMGSQCIRKRDPKTGLEIGKTNIPS